MRSKPLVVMDLSSTGKGGGPFTSTHRTMNSSLKEKYDFKTILYKTEMGKNIKISRILDLRKQLVELNPDIVHFTGLQLSGLHVILACKLAGIKNTVVTVRGFAGDTIDLHPLKRLLITCFIEPLTLLLSKKIYGVSKYVVSRPMIRLFSYKCCGAIYNFPPEPYQKKDGQGIREELGLSPSDVVAVSVARINKEKGYHILDEAILKFKDITNLKFIIVGKGDYLAKMRDKLSEQVKASQVFFLEYRSDIPRILSECDFFILPTLHETLSVALLEASVERLALIASNTGGVPEIVENEYNGLLVPPGDVDALAKAIERVFCDQSLRKQFSANAYKRIEERFKKEIIENRIEEIYTSLVKI